MTERELEAAVANLSPRRHALYEAIHEHGPLTVREIMEREVGGPAKKASLSDLLRPLRAEGLITSAGLRNVGRHLAVLWRTTDAADVEEAAEQYRADEMEAAARVREHGSEAAKSELFRRWQTGDWDEWYHAREKLSRLAMLVPVLEPMAFWEAAPEEDVPYALADLRRLHAAVGALIEEFEAREADVKLQVKVENIANTNGRFPGERRTYRAKARRMARNLVPRDDGTR